MHKLILIALACALFLCACSADEPLPTLMALDVTTPAPGMTSTWVIMPNAEKLQFWIPVEGTLESGTAQSWIFSAQQGDDVTLRAIGRGSAPTLSLNAPDGNIIGQTQNAGDSVQAILPFTGDYTVIVSSAISGAYELGLRHTNQPNPLTENATPLPQVVGVPTPLPVYAGLGTFIAELESDKTVGGLFEDKNQSESEGDSESAGEGTDENLTQHVYTFNGAANEYVTIELNHVSGDINPLLTLYNADGVALAVDADSGAEKNALLRNIRLPDDGIYSVQAASNLPGGYALRLSKMTAPMPLTPTVIITPTGTPKIPELNPTLSEASIERLRDHVPVIGILTDPEDLTRHAFYAEKGSIFTVGLRPLENSALIPRLELIDPNGIPVAAVSGNISPTDRDAVIAAFTAPETGPYTAFITAEGESFGRYMVGYGIGSTWAENQRGEAVLDRANEARIRQSGVRDLWYVHLIAGDLITASVSPLDGALDSVLELVMENGTLIGIDNHSGGPRNPLINGVRIPETGLYYFRVWAAKPDSARPYALIWRYVDFAPTPTPPEGTVSLLMLDDSIEDQQYQFYPFQGQAGQRVRIRVIGAPGSAFDPVAVLLAPDAAVIAEGDDTPDGGLNPIFEAKLPVNGTYQVRVNGYQTGGAFTLIVEALY